MNPGDYVDIPEWYCTNSARGEGWGSRGQNCPFCDRYMFDGTESVTGEAWWDHYIKDHGFSSRPPERTSMANTTVVIQIGNTDDKLTQKKWSEFVGNLQRTMHRIPSGTMHFFGFSPSDASWQNCCIVAEINSDNVGPLRRELRDLCALYNQDSIALLVGDIEFVERWK